jgi:hypothetical protein
MGKYGYRFSFGTWNIHEGVDPFLNCLMGRQE